MNNLAFASIAQLRQKIATKQISSDQLVEFFIDRFAQHDQKIKSALELFDRQSILTSAKSQGELVGIPGMVKDNICQQGRITSCASRMLSNYTATYDATAIARLKTSGASIIGRANMDEFAMGSSTETSAYFKTANPWDVTRVPGGSSGGSAAAVAAGLVPWALGSDTGGSVRQPAAFCGIVGLKPTYGLVSRYGLIAYASSFDQIGVLTRTVADNAQILSIIAGHDNRDSSSLSVESADYTPHLTGSLKTGLVIGVIDNALNAQGIDPHVHSAIETAIAQLQKLGATIKRISIPAMEYSAAIYWILSRAQAASNLARFDGVRYGYRDPDAQQLYAMYANSRENGFGSEVKRRILIGNYVLSVGHADAYYGNAKKAQAHMRHEFMESFKSVDLLLAPTAPMPAFKIGAYDTNKVQMDLQDYYTCPMNVIGIPAISVPCGFSPDNLPIGLQLIGPHLSEQLLYQTAHAYEQATPWHTMHPQGY